MGPSPDTRHVWCRVTPDWGGLQQNHLSETSMNALSMPRSNNRCLWSDNPPKCHHAHMAGCTTTPQPHPDKTDQQLHHHHFGQTYNTTWHATYHLMLPTLERYSTRLLMHCSNLVANHWQHACPSCHPNNSHSRLGETVLALPPSPPSLWRAMHSGGGILANPKKPKKYLANLANPKNPQFFFATSPSHTQQHLPTGRMAALLRQGILKPKASQLPQAGVCHAPVHRSPLCYGE